MFTLMTRHALTAITSTVCLFALFTPQATAYSGAAGSSAVDSFTYEFNGLTLTVPTGCFLTHVVKGSGKRVTSQLAGVDCVGPAAFSQFCNWRIDFSYADTNNRTYKTSRGKTHTACANKYPTRRIGSQKLARYGKACAKFFISGTLRATQCHYITK
ncbi:hypothetical protein [Streptomyces sparsus]